MQQRDYILRMIEAAGAVLREALRRVLGGSASEEEVHDAIDRAGARVGIDARPASGCHCPVMATAFGTRPRRARADFPSSPPSPG